MFGSMQHHKMIRFIEGIQSVTDEAYEGSLFEESQLGNSHIKEMSLTGRDTYTDIYAGLILLIIFPEPLFSNSIRFEDVSGLSPNK